MRCDCNKKKMTMKVIHVYRILCNELQSLCLQVSFGILEGDGLPESTLVDG